MKNALTKFIQILNQNKLFKFVSSIRLAIPIMITIIFSIAAGTIYESMYNADYANLMVYGTFWFFAVLCLLALNIFTSMMSRFPWKKHHLGFVLTHIGILILLFGALVTSRWGLDGTLQIPVGQSERTLILSKLMVGYQQMNFPSFKATVFDRSLKKRIGSDLDSINKSFSGLFTVEQIIPFARLENNYVTDESQNSTVAVSFGLKSAFFDVKEWLHSNDNPQMQMGPASLKLVIDAKNPPPVLVTKTTSVKSLDKNKNKLSLPGDYLIIRSAKTKNEIKKIKLQDLKQGITFDNILFQLKKSYVRASVQQNKLAENSDPNAPSNPAIEFTMKKDNTELREVLYANFPGFTLNPEGGFGYNFEFVSSNDSESTKSKAPKLPPGHPQITTNAESTSDQTLESNFSTEAQGSNVIEFHFNKNKPDVIRLELWKSGQLLANKELKEGETFQTPWMGIQVFIGSILIGAKLSEDIQEVLPTKGGGPLPASAIQIRTRDSGELHWISQGDSKILMINEKPIQIGYGSQTHLLPFSLKLENFSKKDYPGTSTPYSYESLVRVEGDHNEHVISMNEPLKTHGYTLYQSSYILNPGQIPISVFSVNKDPGRPIKYLGSLIMCLGILIFTFMRSHWFKNLGSQRKKS